VGGNDILALGFYKSLGGAKMGFSGWLTSLLVSYKDPDPLLDNFSLFLL